MPFDLPQYGGSDNGLGKIDYHLNDHHTINGSYFSASTMNMRTPRPPSPSPIGTKCWECAAKWLALVEVWTPNSSWLNEVRVGWDHDSRPVASAECSANGSTADPLGLSSSAGQSGGPNYATQLWAGLRRERLRNSHDQICQRTITAVLGFGNNRADVEGSYQGADNVSYTRGKHQFKFGVDTRSLNFTGTKVQDSQRGTITFGSPGFAAFAGRHDRDASGRFPRWRAQRGDHQGGQSHSHHPLG